jgi:perosamine synthetase
MKKLRQWNIDSRPVFYPISHMPMFETKHNPNAEFFSNNGINLPSGHNLIEEDINYICEVIQKILLECR